MKNGSIKAAKAKFKPIKKDINTAKVKNSKVNNYNFSQSVESSKSSSKFLYCLLGSSLIDFTITYWGNLVAGDGFEPPTSGL